MALPAPTSGGLPPAQAVVAGGLPAPLPFQSEDPLYGAYGSDTEALFAPKPLVRPLSPMFSPVTAFAPGQGGTGIATYQGSALAQYAAAQKAAALQAAGLPVDGDPNAWTPEEAIAQTDTALAKLAVTDPERAQELQMQREGYQDDQGFIGSLVHGILELPVIGDVAQAGLKALELLGRPARIIPEMLMDDEDPWYTDIAQALSGESEASWAKVFNENGFDVGFIDNILGFALDVATDPLSYLTFGTGGLGRAAISQAGARAGFIAAGKNVGEEALAHAATVLGTKTVDETLETIFGKLTGQLQPLRFGASTTTKAGKVVMTDEAAGALERIGLQRYFADQFSEAFRVSDAVTRISTTTGFGRMTAAQAEALGIPLDQVKEVLSHQVALGAGSRAAYDPARAAAGVLGGWRWRVAVPFTDLRYISAPLGGTSKLDFSVARALFNGTSGSTRLMKALGEGLAKPDDVMRFFDGAASVGSNMPMQVGGFRAMKNVAAGANPDLVNFMGKGALHMGSAYYQLSEMVGRTTAHFSPDAALLRGGGLGALQARNIRLFASDARRNLAAESWKTTDPTTGDVYNAEKTQLEVARALKDSTRHSVYNEYREFIPMEARVQNGKIIADPQQGINDFYDRAEATLRAQREATIANEGAGFKGKQIKGRISQEQYDKTLAEYEARRARALEIMQESKVTPDEERALWLLEQVGHNAKRIGDEFGIGYRDSTMDLVHAAALRPEPEQMDLFNGSSVADTRGVWILQADDPTVLSRRGSTGVNAQDKTYGGPGGSHGYGFHLVYHEGTVEEAMAAARKNGNSPVITNLHHPLVVTLGTPTEEMLGQISKSGAQAGEPLDAAFQEVQKLSDDAILGAAKKLDIHVETANEAIAEINRLGKQKKAEFVTLIAQASGYDGIVIKEAPRRPVTDAVEVVVNKDGSTTVRAWHHGNPNATDLSVEISGGGMHLGTKKAATDREAVGGDVGWTTFYDENGEQISAFHGGQYSDDVEAEASSLEAGGVDFSRDFIRQSDPDNFFSDSAPPMETFPVEANGKFLDISESNPDWDQGANHYDVMITLDDGNITDLAQLQREGYDGVIYRNNVEDSGSRSVMVFDPRTSVKRVSQDGSPRMKAVVFDDKDVLLLDPSAPALNPFGGFVPRSLSDDVKEILGTKTTPNQGEYLYGRPILHHNMSRVDPRASFTRAEELARETAAKQGFNIPAGVPVFISDPMRGMTNYVDEAVNAMVLESLGYQSAHLAAMGFGKSAMIGNAMATIHEGIIANGDIELISRLSAKVMERADRANKAANRAGVTASYDMDAQSRNIGAASAGLTEELHGIGAGYVKVLSGAEAAAQQKFAQAGAAAVRDIATVQKELVTVMKKISKETDRLALKSLKEQELTLRAQIEQLRGVGTTGKPTSGTEAAAEALRRSAEDAKVKAAADLQALEEQAVPLRTKVEELTNKQDLALAEQERLAQELKDTAAGSVASSPAPPKPGAPGQAPLTRNAAGELSVPRTVDFTQGNPDPDMATLNDVVDREGGLYHGTPVAPEVIREHGIIGDKTRGIPEPTDDEYDEISEPYVWDGVFTAGLKDRAGEHGEYIVKFDPNPYKEKVGGAYFDEAGGDSDVIIGGDIKPEDIISITKRDGSVVYERGREAATPPEESIPGYRPVVSPQEWNTGTDSTVVLVMKNGERKDFVWGGSSGKEGSADWHVYPSGMSAREAIESGESYIDMKDVDRIEIPSPEGKFFAGSESPRGFQPFGDASSPVSKQEAQAIADQYGGKVVSAEEYVVRGKSNYYVLEKRGERVTEGPASVKLIPNKSNPELRKLQKEMLANQREAVKAQTQLRNLETKMEIHKAKIAKADKALGNLPEARVVEVGDLPTRTTKQLTRAEQAVEKVQGEATKAAQKIINRERKQAVKMDRQLRAYGETVDALQKAIADLHIKAATVKPALLTPREAAESLAGFVPLKGIKYLEDAWMPAYMAAEIMHTAQGYKHLNEVQRHWRQFVMGPWKDWATWRWPSFHVRNAMGAFFNNWMGGVGLEDYTFAYRLRKATKEAFYGEDGTWASIPVGASRNMSKAEAKEASEKWLRDHGMTSWAAGEEVTYGDFANRVLSPSGLTSANGRAFGEARIGTEEILRAQRRGVDWPVWGQYTRGAQKAGDVTENFFRTAGFLRGLRVSKGDIAGARAFVMIRQGDYSDLTDWEYGWVRDLIPFYKWMRTNTPYQIHQLFENPVYSLGVQKAETALFEAQGIDQKEFESKMPEWMRDDIAFPMKSGDALNMIILDLPISDLAKTSKDYFSAILPMARPFFESQVLEKNVFTGQDLGTGKLVPMSSVFNVPLVKDILASMPGITKDVDGRLMVDAKLQHMTSAIPVMSRFRDWIYAEPSRVEMRASTAVSALFGFQARPWGAEQLTDAELRFYNDQIVPMMNRMRSQGIEFPDKDELAPAAYTYLGIKPPEQPNPLVQALRSGSGGTGVPGVPSASSGAPGVPTSAAVPG